VSIVAKCAVFGSMVLCVDRAGVLNLDSGESLYCRGGKFTTILSPNGRI